MKKNWPEIVADWKKSKMSVAGYARQNRLKENTLRYYVNKDNRPVGKAKVTGRAARRSGPTFVQVGGQSDMMEVENKKTGIMIRVPATASQEAIRNAVAAINE